MGHKGDTSDFRVGNIAARQHGVISLRQLEELGLSRYAVAKRAQRGRLHRVHRGVYAVGHRGLGLHGGFMAAVLACGEEAVLSHGSAAVLWGLLRPLDGPAHVSVPTTAGLKKRRGIHLHRTSTLQETTRRHNIPVTAVPRTIEDLRRTSFPPRLYRRAKRQAELMGHRLDGIKSDRTRSDLEALFLAICHRYGIPSPEVNVKLGRWEVDFLWREQRVVVETDYWTYHRGSVAFEDDHARDLDLRAEGLTVLRFTDKQLEDEPERVAADVARAIRL
jgi:hypothetical protein